MCSNSYFQPEYIIADTKYYFYFLQISKDIKFHLISRITRTFTEGVEIRVEISGIILLRIDEDTYLNLLSMHIPLTKKIVTLVGQTITPP